MSKETKIQTIAACIAAIIALLRIFGVTAFDDLTEDKIAAIATAIVMIGTWAYASHYKNNDFTPEACRGTGVTRQLKQEKFAGYIGDTFYPEEEEGYEDEQDDLETD